jgi:hypothetical protein
MAAIDSLNLPRTIRDLPPRRSDSLEGVVVRSPLGTPVDARFRAVEDTAYLESAQALWLALGSARARDGLI